MSETLEERYPKEKEHQCVDKQSGVPEDCWEGRKEERVGTENQHQISMILQTGGSDLSGLQTLNRQTGITQEDIRFST